MTCSNQQSFHVLTIFEHHTTYKVCYDLGMFSWGVGRMRGKNGGLRDVVLAELLESRYLPMRQFLINKQTVRWDLVVLLHLHGLGVLRAEVRVVKMGMGDEELMNSWRLQPCSWFSSNFYDARDYHIWGYLNVPSWHKKISQCHATT